MNNYTLDEYMSEIKNSVTMDMLCAHLGIPITRNRTIVCPFHGDSHPSCKIYDGNRGYYCFVCHQGGDVFNFAQKYFKTDYYHTLLELSPLAGIDLRSDQRDMDAIRASHKQREQDRLDREREHQHRQDEYDKWLKKYVQLDKILMNKPNSIDDITDEYAKASRNIAYVEWRLELAQNELRKE